MLNQRDLCVDKGSCWTGTASVSMKSKIAIMLFPSPVFKYGISLILPGTHKCRRNASVAVTPKRLQYFRTIWCFQDLSVHMSIVMCGKSRDIIKDAIVQRPSRPFLMISSPIRTERFYRFVYSPANKPLYLWKYPIRCFCLPHLFTLLYPPLAFKSNQTHIHPPAKKKQNNNKNDSLKQSPSL